MNHQKEPALANKRTGSKGPGLGCPHQQAHANNNGNINANAVALLWVMPRRIKQKRAVISNPTATTTIA
ncbi:hypothetical protein [Prochlorococcus marinus]|uniref:hypothetical protein n=1 Tax=Prochlorococcus marinus TaxID=1219 RepID=UPI001389A257|nr:hypothetical protein [Prochlorococcus marinus]